MRNRDFNPLTGSVFGVFLYYSVPEIVAILALSSASIIDAIFLGRFVGPEALAAVNLSVPVFALMYGCGMMVAIGGSVVCGKYLGEASIQQADAVFTSTIIFALAVGVTILAIGGLSLQQLVGFLGATDASLAELLETYLGIFFWFMPFLMAELVLFYFVRLDGQPAIASGALVVGALVNITLDWWLIVEKDMGILGAAYATALSSVSACLILGPYLLAGRTRLNFTKPLTDWSELFKAYSNGASEFANEASVGVTTFIFNWVMITSMGVNGVAALTIIDALLMFGLIASYGICDSLQPIISQNFGAQDGRRIWAFLRMATVWVASLALVIILFMIFLPEVLIGLFLRPGESEAARIATDFLRVLWPLFLFAGLNILISTYLTSMQKPMESAFIAFSRSFAMPAALLLLLPIWFGDVGIYLALPVAEAVTFALAVMFFTRNQPYSLIRRDRALQRLSETE